MKRCTNCGWLNPDTAVRCVKCDDEDMVFVEAEPVADSDSDEESESVVNPVRQEFTATVLDTSAVLEKLDSSHCPKCNYPLSGDVESCPNCGNVIKKKPEPVSSPVLAPISNSTVLDVDIHAMPVPKPVKVGLRETVRDLPQELVTEENNEDLFKLVSVDGQGEALIKMRLGDVVVISGRRYKFQK